MSKGFVKFWRSMIETDLTMPDSHFKLWMYLLCRAVHTEQRNLKAGELFVTYEELRGALVRHDGTTFSPATIADGLHWLERRGYIHFLRRERNRPMHIGITRWHEFQGEHDKGHDFNRCDHQYSHVVS
jgi:hypothetical protein